MPASAAGQGSAGTPGTPVMDTTMTPAISIRMPNGSPPIYTPAGRTVVRDTVLTGIIPNSRSSASCICGTADARPRSSVTGSTVAMLSGRSAA